MVLFSITKRFVFSPYYHSNLYSMPTNAVSLRDDAHLWINKVHKQFQPAQGANRSKYILKSNNNPSYSIKWIFKHCRSMALIFFKIIFLQNEKVCFHLFQATGRQQSRRTSFTVALQCLGANRFSPKHTHVTAQHP